MSGVRLYRHVIGVNLSWLSSEEDANTTYERVRASESGGEGSWIGVVIREGDRTCELGLLGACSIVNDTLNYHGFLKFCLTPGHSWIHSVINSSH